MKHLKNLTVARTCINLSLEVPVTIGKLSLVFGFEAWVSLQEPTQKEKETIPSDLWNTPLLKFDLQCTEYTEVIWDDIPVIAGYQGFKDFIANKVKEGLDIQSLITKKEEELTQEFEDIKYFEKYRPILESMAKLQ